MSREDSRLLADIEPLLKKLDQTELDENVSVSSLLCSTPTNASMVSSTMRKSWRSGQNGTNGDWVNDDTGSGHGEVLARLRRVRRDGDATDLPVPMQVIKTS
jgi:hypothetical protein